MLRAIIVDVASGILARMTTIDSALAHHALHREESQDSRINWLRAAVLGANDGIVSVAAIVVGVAGAAGSAHVILVAGISGLVAGAFSMALGEYVSVSAQRDIEDALLAKERQELIDQPEEELQELTMLYAAKGLSYETARRVAEELTAHDAFAAHADIELNIDPHELTSPLYAALASAASFLGGALVPIVCMMVFPHSIRVPSTVIAVLGALAITGALGAHVGGAAKIRAALRVVVGGAAAMAVTFGIGMLFGVSDTMMQ